jgi:hypothetical protein
LQEWELCCNNVGLRTSHDKESYMIRLVSLVFFLGCALAVAHYYALGSTVQLLGAIIIAFGLMRLLRGKRINVR